VQVHSVPLHTLHLCESGRVVCGKGKAVPELIQAPRHEGVLGEWGYNPTNS
jgi:hypothetical protein